MVQRQLTRRIYLTETNESTTLEHNECANDDSARIESTLSFLCDETSPLSTPLKWVVWGPLILLRGGGWGGGAYYVFTLFANNIWWVVNGVCQNRINYWHYVRIVLFAWFNPCSRPRVGKEGSRDVYLHVESNRFCMCRLKTRKKERERKQSFCIESHNFRRLIFDCLLAVLRTAGTSQRERRLNCRHVMYVPHLYLGTGLAGIPIRASITHLWERSCSPVHEIDWEIKNDF